MQKRNSIINVPLIGGIALSIAVHAAALYSRGTSHTPPTPKLDAGRTVVQLTLIPSIANQPAPPEPVTEPEPVQEMEPHPEPVVIPVSPVQIPLPEPIPEPVVEKQAEPEPEPVVEPEPLMEQRPQQVESIEQEATLIEDKGVITDAQPSQGIVASYPRISQRRGEEGTVTLSIQVMPNGKAGKISIVKSSGSNRLDDAAIKAAKKSRYTPAEQFGRPIESTLIQPITFKLTRH
ncbi:energy transducer TonB [Pontiellaceae bacterium B12227]|nr:energy transducer TonB [Pontiellaceae bacterium B12227]